MTGFARHCPGCKGFTPAWDECHGSTLEEVLMAYARCNFDGLPVHPRDQEIIGNFLATLKHRVSKPGLCWRELRQDAYWQEWYCEPPFPRHRFRVTREDWAEEDGPVRRIFEIEVCDGPQSERRTIIRAGPAGPGSAPGPPGESPGPA